ncbi:MAG: DUF885 domain-containing protein [Anaerolineae bacterium]|jgi:uncharacterized protein (DUF885 family)
MTQLQSLFDEYLVFVFSSDPIEATRLGMHEYDHVLGDDTPDAISERATKRRSFLSRFEALDPADLTVDEAMDVRLAIIDIKTAQRRHQDLRVWERAPYWYLERLGGAFSNLIGREFASLEERGQRLLSRLQRAPTYLSVAQNNLTTRAPQLYVEMGLTAAKGLGSFLNEAVLGFAADLSPALETDVQQAVRETQSALARFLEYLAHLHAQASGQVACGPDHFDFLLREFHLVDMDHQSLYQFGLERVEEDRRRLEAYAQRQDPTRSWVEQIDQVKEHHPPPAEFKDAYGREMVLAREHCVEQDLITLPEGEVCHMEWLPTYLRASLPIGVMNTTPPFEPGLESNWLITPLDPDAPPERQKQHMRDNCYAFARSIALHEIYPGHHLQKVHHKLATQDLPIRRFFSSPVFVEGWGLYTEDLFEETGFIHEPPVMLFKLRNALWRSVRVVIDSGLHTRSMAFEEAVDLLATEVFLDRHMAEGEVRRYTTHNNPTYPSSYLVGKTLIQALREKWQERQGSSYSLKAFHDHLLSYGSPPVRLIAERMLS